MANGPTPIGGLYFVCADPFCGLLHDHGKPRNIGEAWEIGQALRRAALAEVKRLDGLQASRKAEGEANA